MRWVVVELPKVGGQSPQGSRSPWTTIPGLGCGTEPFDTITENLKEPWKEWCFQVPHKTPATIFSPHNF